MKKLVLIMLALILILTACGEKKGTYLDFAAIKDAQRTMTKLTNLMEQYYVEHDSYPDPNEDFEKQIRPYFITYNRNNEPVDKWSEMVEGAFLDGKLYYESNDPKVAYYIYGKAKDSNHTIVFCRPAVQHKVEEEKTKK